MQLLCFHDWRTTFQGEINKRWRVRYLSNLPPGRIWHKVILMWGASHARPSQKMFDPVGILLMGHHRRQAMNSALYSRYCLRGLLLRDQASQTKHSIPSIRDATVRIPYCVRLGLHLLVKGRRSVKTVESDCLWLVHR